MVQQSLNIRDLLRNLRSLILITLVEFLATQVRAGQIGKQNSNRVNINIVMFEKVHSQKISQFKIMIIVKANLGFNYICATPLNTLALNESNRGWLVWSGIFSPQIFICDAVFDDRKLTMIYNYSYSERLVLSRNNSFVVTSIVRDLIHQH